jgi:hypothetical protein
MTIKVTCIPFEKRTKEAISRILGSKKSAWLSREEREALRIALERARKKREQTKDSGQS